MIDALEAARLREQGWKLLKEATERRLQVEVDRAQAVADRHKLALARLRDAAVLDPADKLFRDM